MPPSPHAAALLLLPCLAALVSVAAEAPATHHSCFHSAADGAPLHLCAPFSQPPSFPFGASPGCGHPAFQIRCSAAEKCYHMRIKGFSFILLNNSGNSLLVSPQPAAPAAPSRFFDVEGGCGPGALAADRLPVHQIDLSGSPFRISNGACSRLAAIRPCRTDLPGLAPGCSDRGGGSGVWHGRLLARPLLLLKGCSSSPYRRLNASGEGGGCHSDVSVAVADFLREGIWIEWDHSDVYFANCSSCMKNSRGTAACGFNNSDPAYPFLCLASDVAAVCAPGGRGGGNRRSPNRVVILTTALFAFTCLSILAVSAATMYRRGLSSGFSRRTGGEDPMTAFLRRHHLQLQPPVFTYDQLCSSTDRFDPKCKIGDGGFGSVYLGKLEDSRVVAVKRLHRQHPAATTKSFCNEILILSSIKHPNLVRLHGYCCDPRGLLLVYDYVPNGTLADHLHGPRSLYKKGSLTWPIRVDVALQTAQALEYLHFSVKPPVVHRDITSSNIFVEKDMRIKVGDFGLSRLLSLPDSSSCSSGSTSCEFVCTGPQGTPGYLDPEYHRSFRLTEKSDVYSFGVVLLELVTGMKAVDLTRDKQELSLAHLVVSKIQVGELHQVVDPVLVRQAQGQGMAAIEAVAELAFRCVAGEKDDRPDARELVSELKRIRNGMHEDSKGS